MDSAQLRQITTLLAALAGVATAVGSCNQAAQDRLKADNKIYTTLASAQATQAQDIMNLHEEVSRIRGYLEATRPDPSATGPSAPATSEAVKPLVPLSELRILDRKILDRNPLDRRILELSSPSLPPEKAPLITLKPLPPLPAAAPAPTLRKLPRFSDL